ncbi:uncharacterized protein LOC125066384 [Vanessa atalanta]|uniref:uncharacterized protein LOC125066384 n=1 Tax=Vanessa atalanta TaxID=42275 RepID=UPI001FCD5819|nr:uncharacterized protein LOC125066384 [Vanessa atalanta]
MGLQFEQRSAHFARFTVAMIVLPSRLSVDWWTNSSQPGQLKISRFPCVNVTRDLPRISPLCATELGLGCYLSLHPYKIQLTQELKVNDHRQRRVFADWALEQLEVDADFGKKIIFSDEAHFWMNGYVNKQNCRIWDETNPHEVHQVAMHPQKVTVWCGFWAGGVIGPYFFENDNGVAVTVNGRRYVPHSTRYDGSSARAISGHGHLARRRRELATEIVRFDPAGLFLVGFS